MNKDENENENGCFFFEIKDVYSPWTPYVILTDLDYYCVVRLNRWIKVL